MAGVIVGGALAARRHSHRQPAPPEPDPRPVVPLLPTWSAIGKPRPKRSLVRMTVGAAMVVVLALAVAVVTRPSTGNQLATPHMVMTRSPGPHGMYVQVSVPGPVGRDERVALTGDNGALVEVSAKLDLEQPSLDDPGQRLVFFEVHVHNTGTVAVLARLAQDALVLDSAGVSHRGDYMRSEMVDMSAKPPLLEPGWEIDLTAGFPVPKDAELTRLHIALPLDSNTPSAEWSLQN